MAVIDATGHVANVIEADPDFTLAGFTLIESDTAGPGYTYANGAFSAPLVEPAAPLVPETISERQFMQQLATDGDITWDECFAYLGTGTIPSVFATAIGQLPAAQQNPAKAAFIGANSFDRHNPLTIMLGAIMQKTDAQMDDIWRAAAAIE